MKISKRIIKIIIPVLFWAMIFNQPAFIYGQTVADENDQVKEISQQIQEKRDQIKKMQEQQEVYENVIQQKQKEKASLNNQLAILENRLAKAALDITSVEVDIDRNNLEIKKVNMQIEEKDKEISRQNEHLANILLLMQKQDNKSALEILLLNNSFTDFVNQIKYLEDINSEVGNSLETLKDYKIQLESQKSDLATKVKELENLKTQLEQKKQSLAFEQANKTYVLDQTRSSEREYQRLLAQARAEQEQAAAEIVSLEKLVRSKLEKIQGKDLEFNDAGFIWPVAKNVVVAYFHDPDYPFRYIFEHPAIDIRAAQGSNVRAAASGYVARAKDSGLGYSYIMIVHGDGLATVYGHVSKIFVAEDEYVVQGQAIGLSGGLPGTRGAGRLTTGPHMHFEVRLNGIPVDPLEYLP